MERSEPLIPCRAPVHPNLLADRDSRVAGHRTAPSEQIPHGEGGAAAPSLELGGGEAAGRRLTVRGKVTGRGR